MSESSLLPAVVLIEERTRGLCARSTAIERPPIALCYEDAHRLFTSISERETILSTYDHNLLRRLHSCMESLMKLHAECEQITNHAFECPVPFAAVDEVATGGRPLLCINPTDLQRAVAEGLRTREIASLFQVSVSTVRRTMKQHGIFRYAEVDDETLAEEIGNIVGDTGHHWGQKLVQGALDSRGLKVTRERIRSTLRTVDTTGHAIRSAKKNYRIHRISRYSVAGPGALWHFDANLKLKKYRFSIHGCVDGFSRKVIYMNVADNMRAETVLAFFIAGCDRAKYIPSRARCDKGGENVLVADFMIHNRGAHRGSILVGPSVHNQRIERLWRDVYAAVIAHVLEVFQQMEAAGSLDVDDDTVMHTLHVVFLQPMQVLLDSFRDSWNAHSMRTPDMGHSSPNRLHGVLTMISLDADRDVELETYGIEQPLNDQEHTEELAPLFPSIADPLPEGEYRVRRDEMHRNLVTDLCPRRLSDYTQVFLSLLPVVIIMRQEANAIAT